MNNNKRISNYFLDLLNNNKISIDLKRKISDFFLNGILLEDNIWNSSIDNISDSYDIEYLIHFFYTFASNDFFAKKRELFCNKIDLIFKLDSIKKNIYIKIVDEYWYYYNLVFRKIKIMILDYLKSKNIFIKLSKNIFLDVYIISSSLTFF